MTSEETGRDRRELLRRAEAAFRAGRLAEAENCFRQVLAASPEQADALHFLGLLAHHRGENEVALPLIRRSIEIWPDWPVFHQNLGGIFLALERPAEAAACFARALELEPESFLTLGSLVMAHDALGDRACARNFGQRCLEAKDRAACAGRQGKALPAGLRAPGFRADRPAENVIAFSLFGDNEYYARYAVENAIGRRFVYPEWTCRFYVDTAVPEPVVARLVREGAQVVRMGVRASGNEGLFWRFLAANDPGVRYFLCRDCDSVLNLRERLAVEEWLESGFPFHLMRDHVVHTELILAGMWGGVGGLLPDVMAELPAFLRGYAGRWADQAWLRQRVWPLIRAVALTHDSNYRIGETRDFPRLGRLPGGAHVGGAMPGKGPQAEFRA
ncbi:MAG: tetratricopeptide repeat protein [Alphaproteobacteria bacterium]|nr:tetratricopeptide repeat protein [Alphaproteobacteria bacterium]